MRNLSAYDSLDALSAIDTEKLERQAKQLIEHPLLFGAGVGIANGLMAAARDMKFSVRATLATAVVLGVGETILALDHTPEERGGRGLLPFALMSGLGVLMGLSMFTDWRQWSVGAEPMLITRQGLVRQNRNAVVPAPSPIMMASAAMQTANANA